MLKDIVSVTRLEGTRLHVRFEDGIEGDLDIAALVPFDGVFAPLNDPAEFAKVAVNPDLGTICWPNGADLDPSVLYSLVTGAPLPGQSA
jgi:hypothetical protein